MIILAIDTASDAVSVAIANGKKLLASAHVSSDRCHAEFLALHLGETRSIDFMRVVDRQ